MEFVDLKALHESIAEELQEAISGVIAQSAFIRGPQVDQFEQDFASLIGSKHCVSCGNGTDALYIALRALGVTTGDEVITTAHTWISTSETISQAGGTVVFADTEDEFFTIDPAQIESLITERTVGIVPVHLYGQPAAMDEIMAIAKRHGLWVLEDCAQAHLAEYKGQKVGTFGDVATFSFYPGKNLGAMGDAGAIVTNNAELATFSRRFANHGEKNVHVMEGINSRMDGLQAAILNVKMKYLEQWTSSRQHIAALYDEHIPQNIKIPTVRSSCRHVYHLYVIRSSNRDGLRQFLAEKGIPSQVNYPRAVPFYAAYDRLGAKLGDFPIAVQHAAEILSLPIHPLMIKEEVIDVVSAIDEFENRG